MDKVQIDLVKYRLDKAYEDYFGAKILYKEKLFSQSINRSYYSIFHSARALLACEKFDTKKHSGVIEYFNKKFIKDGLLETEFFRIINIASRFRINTDYKDFYLLTKEDTKAQLDNALKFYKRIKKYIKEIYDIK